MEIIQSVLVKNKSPHRKLGAFKTKGPSLGGFYFPLKFPKNRAILKVDKSIKEKIKKYLILIIITGGLLAFNFSVFAHPGNTASDGCHYCRTNCTSWGVAWNQRHCHGEGSSYGGGSSSNSDGSSIWWWIIGIGIVGYVFYAFKKK